MALISCPECNKQISDQSNSCPHCGYPMKPQRSDPQPPPLFYGKQKREEESKSYGLGTFLLILFVGYVLYQCTTSYSDYKERTQQNSASSSTSANSSSTESQPQTIANRFPNLQNVEEEAIISKNISEDMLKTMIQIVQLHGNKCDTISAATDSYDGSTFNLKCNLYRYSYNFVDKGGEWQFEVEN